MCRGGGFAYELQSEYDGQHDEACLKESEEKLGELQQRQDKLAAIQAARTSQDATAYYRAFYIDYCMEKNLHRNPESTEGECGFIDQRLLSGKWRELANVLGLGGKLAVQDENHLSRKRALMIFNTNIQLPAKLGDIKHELLQNGFECKTDQTCEITYLVIPYRDAKIFTFGRYIVTYSFAVENEMVTDIEAKVMGTGL